MVIYCKRNSFLYDIYLVDQCNFDVIFVQINNMDHHCNYVEFHHCCRIQLGAARSDDPASTEGDIVKHTCNLHAIAQEIKAAQDEVRQMAPLTSRLAGFDEALAYGVAQLVHQARLKEGAVPVGRKIGFTNPDMWSLYGVRKPIWGYVYDATVVHVHGEHAICRLGGFTEPKIEPEIIFHFHTSPPTGGDVATIIASIDWIAHGFEIVQSHFPDWKFRAADTVADQGLHGTLLIGRQQPTDWFGPSLPEKLERFAVSLFRNDSLRETGTGANVLGSPLLAIAHLVAVLQDQPNCPPLQPGELVTTGTITTAQPVQAGECWRTDVRGIDLPGLSVEFLA